MELLTRARCRAATAVLLEASADFASFSSALARAVSVAIVFASASGVVSSSCFECKTMLEKEDRHSETLKGYQKCYIMRTCELTGCGAVCFLCLSAASECSPFGFPHTHCPKAAAEVSTLYAVQRCRCSCRCTALS